MKNLPSSGRQSRFTNRSEIFQIPSGSALFFIFSSDLKNTRNSIFPRYDFRNPQHFFQVNWKMSWWWKMRWKLFWHPLQINMFQFENNYHLHFVLTVNILLLHARNWLFFCTICNTPTSTSDARPRQWLHFFSLLHHSSTIDGFFESSENFDTWLIFRLILKILLHLTYFGISKKKSSDWNGKSMLSYQNECCYCLKTL